MGTLTDLSAIINRLTGGNAGNPQHPMVFIDNRIGAAALANSVGATLNSYWQNNRAGGSVGQVPAAATACTSATAGAIPFTNPAVGKQLWLLGVSGTISSAGVIVLYDRLLHNGGLSGTVTTAQTVGGTITRNTGGVGNEIWIEIYTQVGATSTTISATYTNQAGTAGRVTPLTSFGNTGFREQGRVLRLALADGDTGVQSVQSVTVTATTGTAGDFGVVIAKPITAIVCPAPGAGFHRDFIAGIPSLVEITPNACLSFIHHVSIASTSAKTMIQLNMIEA